LPRRRKGRPLDGVLLLDKPQGLTSNAALQRVRRLFGAQKAGHTGALDPLATGVLPICLGEATKFSKYLLDADKGYYTTATLGEIRDSGDSDGALVERRPVPMISDDALEQVLDRFRGDIDQVPSMYSALKYQGRPLYEWARKGIEIERPARPITIYHLETSGRTEATIDLSVECSKGTYIRSLVEDIGTTLGCGAHVSMLRRFKAGHFRLESCTTLDVLQSLEGDFEALDQYLLPSDILLQNFPSVSVNKALGDSILHGQAVRIPRVENSGLSRLYIESEDSSTAPVFSGLVEVSEEGECRPARLINFGDRTYK